MIDWSVVASAIMALTYRFIAAGIVVVMVYAIYKASSRILRAIAKGVESEYLARITETLKVSMYFVAGIAAAAILAPEVQLFSMLILLVGLAIVVMLFDALRNVGSEFYVRAKNIVKRGDWIEIDGITIRVLDLESLGIVGETMKLERVFVPYTRMLNAVLINKATPLGILSRVTIRVPTNHSIEESRIAIAEAIDCIKAELALEPDVTYLGIKDNSMVFEVSLYVVNYRKVGRVIESLERELLKRISDASIKA
ncbi:MAG: mechanosensitive ion channel [Sulfolobales archaeon]|nr:mechanosensitive ion channel [Sulfolobales archaeon]MCX8198744.1 mechanosensitive ion channel [Sulfolobales archaeon]MDW8169817.1 mechanosensitive ion channel [Desulfurococcaceae archaeon]